MQVGTGWIRGGQCVKFQTGSLLGPDFFGYGSSMGLIRSRTGYGHKFSQNGLTHSNILNTLYMSEYVNTYRHNMCRIES
jgi:hypothetical protein